MTKAELRRIYLKKQKSISADERSRLSRRIAEKFFAGFDLSSIEALHCFISIAKFNEIDTAPIFRRLWAEFPRIRTLVPRVNFENGKMEAVPYAAGTELLANEWGVHEPTTTAAFDSREVDIVIVPGVAFDESFNRVGYGKGFYDRFLASCRPNCIKIGVSYFPLTDPVSDVAGHDVPVDYCLTPDSLFAHGTAADILFGL